MTDKKLRWGVISTANIGRAAVNPAIQASENGELAAVASRDEQKARAFANKHGIPKSYGSYEALLDDKDIDAVYIPLPNHMHREWTIKAAQNGKHILCEKPLALNTAECEEMQAAARANNVKLMEAFMYRFHPQTAKVMELLNYGAVGELRFIRSAFTFRLNRPDDIRFDPNMGGGALMDVGCYCVNVSRTLAGSEPVEVWAAANWTGRGVDEQLAGMLCFENGVIAQFDCAISLAHRATYEAVGSKGYLQIPSAFRPGTEKAFIYEQHDREKTARHTVKGADQYRLMVEHFTDCVLNDRPLRYPVEDGVNNMRVIDALYRSARSGGKPVEV